MKKGISNAIVIALISSSCIGGKYGSAVKSETTKVNIVEKNDLIPYAALQAQEIPTFESRTVTSRGLTPDIVGGAVSLATSAIKQMIAKDKKKYTAQYTNAISDLYFYDQLSARGPFDPLGMQFTGFKFIRTFKNGNKIDTALQADFELDMSNPYEVINNSVFRLVLKDLKLNYAKAKVAAGSDHKLNIDFEITFTSSFVNSNAELFQDVELGKFFLFVRRAPLRQSDAGYDAYYAKLKGKKLEGKSFIVPRSLGYHISEANNLEQSFSQGAYTINIKIKESSKNTFVNQLITDNSGKLIDALGGQIKKKLK